MQTIRSFIAIPLNKPLKSAAERMMDRMRDSIANVKWSEAENLHLTLKFLGDVDNREIPDVCRRLRDCCVSAKPFTLAFLGAGAFPNVEKPRVVWAGVQDDEGHLCNLVNHIEKHMSELGFKQEFRDYRPHLTLGRVEKGRRADGAEAAIAAENDSILGSLHVHEVCLYASYLERGGATHNVMDRIPLHR